MLKPMTRTAPLSALIKAKRDNKALVALVQEMDAIIDIMGNRLNPSFSRIQPLRHGEEIVTRIKAARAKVMKLGAPK